MVHHKGSYIAKSDESESDICQARLSNDYAGGSLQGAYLLIESRDDCVEHAWDSSMEATHRQSKCTEIAMC